MHTNGVDAILSELYDLVMDARDVPFTSDKCIINKDQVLDLIEEATAMLPNSIKQAHEIVSSGNEMLELAKRDAEATLNIANQKANDIVSFANVEADRITKKAKERAEELISKETVCFEALKRSEQMIDETKRKCQEMIDRANNEIDELREANNQHMEDLIRKTKSALSDALKDVQVAETQLNLSAEAKPMSNNRNRQQSHRSFFDYEDCLDDTV